jgi:hypothetical protein
MFQTSSTQVVPAKATLLHINVKAAIIAHMNRAWLCLVFQIMVAPLTVRLLSQRLTQISERTKRILEVIFLVTKRTVSSRAFVAMHE